jgi:hypothetical protein
LFTAHGGCNNGTPMPSEASSYLEGGPQLRGSGDVTVFPERKFDQICEAFAFTNSRFL